MEAASARQLMIRLPVELYLFCGSCRALKISQILSEVFRRHNRMNVGFKYQKTVTGIFCCEQLNEVSKYCLSNVIYCCNVEKFIKLLWLSELLRSKRPDEGTWHARDWRRVAAAATDAWKMSSETCRWVWSTTQRLRSCKDLTKLKISIFYLRQNYPSNFIFHRETSLQNDFRYIFIPSQPIS